MKECKGNGNGMPLFRILIHYAELRATSSHPFQRVRCVPKLVFHPIKDALESIVVVARQGRQ